MNKYKTQICLVSGQSIPNITPILDENIRPEKVILCATNAMINNAELLKTFLNLKKIETEIYKLGDAYEFAELKEKFLEIASEIPADCAINLTGGNKLMTIAAQEVFDGVCDMFYVTFDKGQIMMINKSNELYQIKSKIKLEDYFSIHGYKINSLERKKTISQEARILFDELINNIEKYSNPLGVLNGIAAEAEYKGSLQIKNSIPQKSWELLTLFLENGAIEYYDDKKIKFKDCESRRFCNGFWFEDYVYLRLSQLHKVENFQDFAMSIQIENKNKVRNEIDAAFIKNNTLHIIECKTAKMDAKGSDVVYKMDTIANLAGLSTKGIIISYRKLSAYDLQRAKDLKINVIQGYDLKCLKLI